MVISEQEYSRFQDLLNKKTGILLGSNKQYLVTSRLTSFLKENQISDFSQLIDKLASFGNNQLLQQVIDRMTTNETLWFRDGFPFNFLISNILPELKQLGVSRASIWCAACSSGQEPYSISMSIEEQRIVASSQLPSQVDILSTDISSRILEQAKKGEYQSIEISRGLSLQRQQRFFNRNDDGSFVLKPELRNKVRFLPLNLMELPYRHAGKFDVIFCRNVLIYFSAELKEKVINGMADCLKPGGYLFLGASESMPTNIKTFDMVRCNPGLVYKKR